MFVEKSFVYRFVRLPTVLAQYASMGNAKSAEWGMSQDETSLSHTGKLFVTPQTGLNLFLTLGKPANFEQLYYIS